MNSLGNSMSRRVEAGPLKPGQPLLSLREAAELLGCSMWTLRRLANRGEIPGRKVGTRVKFNLPDC